MHRRSAAATRWRSPARSSNGPRSRRRRPSPSVPPAFDAIVERLTSPNVARRYRSADEVGRRPRSPPRSRSRRRALRPVVVAAPIAALEPEKKSNAGWIAAVVILILAIVGIGAWLLLRDDSSKEKVTVPAVVGQPVLQAQNAIDQAGFHATTVNQASATVRGRASCSTSRRRARRWPRRAREVRLSVSTGPPPTTSTSTTSTTTHHHDVDDHHDHHHHDTADAAVHVAVAPGRRARLAPRNRFAGGERAG